MMNAQFLFCGQSGIHIRFADGGGILIDPYFTDEVARLYGAELARQIHSPYGPGEPRGIKTVLITHAHADHADTGSLEQIVAVNPNVIIIGPVSVEKALKASPQVAARFCRLNSPAISSGTEISITAVPAAHTELCFDSDGQPECCGYLIRADGVLFYHAGDTMPHPEIVKAVQAAGIPDVAFLPCNERNYYRERAGIIGNMSVREMLHFAGEIKARRIVPIHWDLFAPNSTYPEEIRLVHEKSGCPIPLTVPEHGRWHSIGELVK